MIDSQRGYNHLIFNKREWNNFFFNNQEILLDLADFALQEQPEDNLMVTNSRAGIMAHIDIFHKWRPINYSFVCMKISLTSLVSMCKIQKNF